MNGYYVDCSINGHLLKGFIDSGYEIVTIRESDAKLAGLSWVDSQVCLNGYGGGRSVLSNSEAITVVKNGSARLFSTKIADMPEIDELPTKITLKNKQKVEIPPHHIGFVTCSTSDKFVIFLLTNPLKEYVIPNCITSMNGATIPILNISESNLCQNDCQKLLLLLNKYRDCFTQNINDLVKIIGDEMKINLTDDKPVTYRPYRL
nr:unnamed protein product [Callosobruchus analis]